MQWQQKRVLLIRARQHEHDSKIIDSDNQNRFCSENSEFLESLCTSLAALSTASKGQGMWRDRYTYPLHYLPFPVESDKQVFLLYKLRITTRKTQLLAMINILMIFAKKKSSVCHLDNSAVIVICPKKNEEKVLITYVIMFKRKNRSSKTNC